MRAHLDMAEISIIAEQTGVTAMGNFRVSEMSLGRQGVSLTLSDHLTT
jgi:1,6-anhydro-N-acetylmuramate kinase